MKVLGLTGNIATGKSTVARMFAFHRVPVFDADQAVHTLMQPGTPVFSQIGALFPDVIAQNRIDRIRLGARVFADDEARLRLEALLHPEIRKQENAFIRMQRRHRRRLVVLDIPLLYETGAQALCDAVAVTHCPPFLQVQRAMQRPGMSEARYRKIVSLQWPAAEKRRRGDVVLVTSIGKGVTMRQVKRLIRKLA